MMKFEIYKYESVTSTNDLAINLIKDKKKTIGFVSSEIQTQGRGTRGKKWISDKGNLFASIFFPLKEKYPAFDEFSIVNCIIVSDIIKKLCNERKKVNLKFPNDILLNGKKVCGLLQEVITFEKNNYLITGIGINIQSNPDIENTYKATNILFETKKKYEKIEIIKLLILAYQSFFKEIDSYNFTQYREQAEAMAIN